MDFAGILPLSLLDWPGRTACVVFTAGCDLHCRFCHNPELVLPAAVKASRADRVPQAAVLGFLAARRGKLDGVVVCGGEPTLHPGLEDFCRAAKALGYPVKLDTNGQRPDVVASLLEQKLVDYVAMDFKHAPEKYDALTQVPGSGARALETARILAASGTDHELRTTVASGVHDAADIAAIRAALPAGIRRRRLQNFRTGTTLDPDFPGRPFGERELEKLAAAAPADTMTP